MALAQAVYDSIDLAVLTSLAEDGRRSGRDLSTKLPVDQGATRLRLQRLLESTVRVKGLVDPSAIGFPVEGFVGIGVHPASITSVINHLAVHERVLYVSGVAGVFDVVCVVISRSLPDFQRVLRDSIGSLDGVKNVETSICLERHLGRFANLPRKLLLEVTDPPPGLSTTDLKMIGCLMDDGRLTARDLARMISISEPTAQKSLKKLIDTRVLTIRGMVKPHSLGFPVTATIGIEADLRKAETIAKALGTHRQMTLVVTCTGTFSLICIGTFRSNSDLDQVLQEFVYPLNGVNSVRTCVVLAEKRAKELWIVPRALGDMGNGPAHLVSLQGDRTVGNTRSALPPFA